MRIELVISRPKQLPEGAGPALEKELKRFSVENESYRDYYYFLK